MRIAFVGAVLVGLATIGIPLSSAGARNANMTPRYHYDACSCRFGYPGSACVSDVACTAEGGRCAESCIPPAQPE
jgi:hypothetical protein